MKRIAVLAPFPNVPVHVVDAEIVGGLAARFVRIELIAVARIDFEPSIFLQPGGLISKTISRFGTCATSVLPFRLCRETIDFVLKV
jgi:hypothetical protein